MNHAPDSRIMEAVEAATAAYVEEMDLRTAKPGEASPRTVEIRLNGEARHIPAATTVAGLLSLLDIHGDRVAIELNRSIVRRPNWQATVIEPDSVLEVVHFVGGG